MVFPAHVTHVSVSAVIQHLITFQILTSDAYKLRTSAHMQGFLAVLLLLVLLIVLSDHIADGIAVVAAVIDYQIAQPR